MFTLLNALQGWATRSLLHAVVVLALLIASLVLSGIEIAKEISGTRVKPSKPRIAVPESPSEPYSPSSPSGSYPEYDYTR